MISDNHRSADYGIILRDETDGNMAQEVVPRMVAQPLRLRNLAADAQRPYNQGPPAAHHLEAPTEGDGDDVAGARGWRCCHRCL